MVTAADIARARDIAGRVEDPELPPVTIAELGVLRGIEADASNGGLLARITPTYSGCPANLVIALAVESALLDAGFAPVRVETELAPPWSSDDVTEGGRAKLKAMGIAPPASPGASETPVCPRCDAADVAEISRFGATACKALWRCNACLEPFEAFKRL